MACAHCGHSHRKHDGTMDIDRCPQCVIGAIQGVNADDDGWICQDFDW